MFSKQETFDIVYKGLAGQGFQRAVDSMGSCVFQDRNGNRCSIGHLVPDGLMPSGVVNGLGGIYNYFKFHDHDLVRDLMSAHDESYSSDEIKERLKQVATRHDLSCE